MGKLPTASQELKDMKELQAAHELYTGIFKHILESKGLDLENITQTGHIPCLETDYDRLHSIETPTGLTDFFPASDKRIELRDVALGHDLGYVLTSTIINPEGHAIDEFNIDFGAGTYCFEKTPKEGEPVTEERKLTPEMVKAFAELLNTIESMPDSRVSIYKNSQSA